MKTINKIFIFSFIALSLFSCTKKKLELEIWQEGCRKFKLKQEVATLDTVATTICDPGLYLEFGIFFKYTKSDECIKTVVNEATFYDANQAVITTGAPSYTDYERLDKSDVTFSAENKSIEYIIGFDFANLTDVSNFNHAILDVHTENEVGNPSNTLKMLLFTPCSQVTSNMYEATGKSVSVSNTQSFFDIKLWDDASEDGDIVSVYLNGEWIIWEHSLTNDGNVFSIPTDKLNSGGNDLVVFAVNYGSDWPNTVAISIDGTEVDLGSYSKELTTGKSVSIKF